MLHEVYIIHIGFGKFAAVPKQADSVSQLNEHVLNASPQPQGLRTRSILVYVLIDLGCEAVGLA